MEAKRNEKKKKKKISLRFLLFSIYNLLNQNIPCIINIAGKCIKIYKYSNFASNLINFSSS